MRRSKATPVYRVQQTLSTGRRSKTRESPGMMPAPLLYDDVAMAETDRGMSARTVESPVVSWEDNSQTPRRE
jgi:hypothetical protein